MIPPKPNKHKNVKGFCSTQHLHETIRGRGENVRNVVWGAVRMYRKNRRSCCALRHNGKLIILWLKGSFIPILRCAFARQQSDCKISSRSWLSFYVVLSDEESETRTVCRRSQTWIVMTMAVRTLCDNGWYQDVTYDSFLLLCKSMNFPRRVHMWRFTTLMRFSSQINKLEWVKFMFLAEANSIPRESHRKLWKGISSYEPRCSCYDAKNHNFYDPTDKCEKF